MSIRADGVDLPGLKKTIAGEGVWRIRRRDNSPVIEVFKIEDSGHGDILSSDFVKWRTEGSLSNGPGAQ